MLFVALMWVVCDKCRTSYEIRDELGGRLSRCKCGASIVLPVPEPTRLLEWAATASWSILFKFILQGGARGHSWATVQNLIRIYEKRREAEHWRLEGLREAQKQKEGELRRQQLLDEEQLRIATALRNNQQLVTMLELSPVDFEQLVADVFRAQGYEAFAVGCSNDGGVDVEIYESDGDKLWAVAQCKRYTDSKIAAKHIREFAGAYVPSKAEKGFYITTGKFTRQALTAAHNYPWLQLYDGLQFASFVASVHQDFAGPGHH